MSSCFFFFFNDTATTEIYTLSLHDALPICDLVLGAETPQRDLGLLALDRLLARDPACTGDLIGQPALAHPQRRRHGRSEEHTSELQSRQYLVCRLLLEKKKIINITTTERNV